jgi:aspartyl-tRNA(Asn)/glutamyl-tRNA(Gln) amidotransferase subunit B
MEKGQMRCEANISISGSEKMGTKVEVKNLNSFKVVEKAIEYEIKRQAELLDEGKEIAQETRGWDESRMITFSQREKESVHDYRYFPEPDLPPLEIGEEYIEKIRAELPELPAQKAKRFVEEYKISGYDALLLTRDKNIAEFFEESVSEAMESTENRDKIAKLTANYILTEIRKYLDEKTVISDLKLTPENFGELMRIIVEGKINSSAAQVVLSEMIKAGVDPEHIIAEKNLAQLEDEREIENIVKKIVEENPEPASEYKAGKQNALQFLVGQTMKETKGKIHPQKAMNLLKKYLI